MVAKTLEVAAQTGLTGLTATAYPIGTDTAAAQVSAAALTEATNRLGWYTCTADDLAAGDYQVKVLNSGGGLVANWIARIDAAAGTYTALESIPDDDDIGYILSALVGAISNAGDADETFAFALRGTTYTVTADSLDADGNRGTTVLSKA